MFAKEFQLVSNSIQVYKAVYKALMSLIQFQEYINNVSEIGSPGI